MSVVSPTAEKLVRSLEQSEASAMLKGDVDALSQYWADEFIVNNPANMVVTRVQVLDLVRAKRIAYVRFDRATEALSVLGDTAIAMGQEVVVPAPGAPFAGQTVTRRYTNIWLRTNDVWRLVGRQATVVSAT
jgi:ketosteroid isomerase-like protein